MSKHIGSQLDDLLREDGVLEEVTAGAIKRVIAWQTAEAMKLQGIDKSELAEPIHTQLNRLPMPR